MARLLKGAPVVAALNEDIAKRAAALAEKGVTPALRIIRVGAREDDVAYEQSIEKRCEKVGVAVKKNILPADAAEEALLAAIKQANEDKSVHGVLLFRPLPKHIDDRRVCEALAPEKDVDGITQGSLAGVFTGGQEGFPPCTAEACMEILDFYGVELKGKRVTVVGRSLVVGKPVSMMLLGRHATVTVCHTRTVDLAKTCAAAEVLIAAAGVRQMVNAEFLSAEQVVVDVGIHVAEDGSMCGDVDFAAAESIVSDITPVPGGVGTVTTSLLAKHVVVAAERQRA